CYGDPRGLPSFPTRRSSDLGVVEHTDVGDDERVDAELGCGVNRRGPARPTLRPRISVDRQENSTAPLMGVFDAFRRPLGGEVQTGEMARVGLVPQPDVDGVRSIVDRRLQRRQRAGRTNQLHYSPSSPGTRTSISTIPASPLAAF